MVRNKNSDEIPTISTARRRLCSVAGINRRFIACNHGMQAGFATKSPSRSAYCTQQTGGLTRGMTLRPIQTAAADPVGNIGLLGVANRSRRYCVQYGSFYAKVRKATEIVREISACGRRALLPRQRVVLSFAGPDVASERLSWGHRDRLEEVWRRR